jgi:hypothetical protein
MTWWWKSLFRKRALDAQLGSEVRFHIDEMTAANIAAGMFPEEARRRAVLEFGGGEQIKEELRDVHRVRVIESAIANLKSAFRFIRKSPSFSAVIIVTLALGIGANSAVFSAIDAILLRPLPFPNSTFGGVVLMMVAVAAIASLIPSIRAARVDPMRVLREE